MNDIELSVIIPVYNTEKFLKKCIDSVLLATKHINRDYEIIIINDGSQGNTDEIMEEYLTNNCIKYVKQENKGRGGARNTGIKLANGRYVSIIDSDDYIDEEMYSKMLNIANEEISDIVVCDFQMIDENKDKKFIVEAINEKISDIKIACYDIPIMPSPCNKIIRRELYFDIEFPEKIGYEDLATIPLLMLKANKISYIHEGLYKYRVNPDSITQSSYGIQTYEIITAFEILFSKIDKLDISNEAKAKAKYMVYTRRLYEDLLEPIISKKIHDRYRLLKEFCDKIADIDSYMLNNEFFKEEVFVMQNNLKRLGNRFLHWCLTNKHPKLLSILLNKRLYYSIFSIMYKNVLLLKS